MAVGLNLVVGGAGDDVLIGDPVDCLVTLRRLIIGDRLDLLIGECVTGDVSVGTDTLIGIDRVFGSDFADTFTVDSDVVQLLAVSMRLKVVAAMTSLPAMVLRVLVMRLPTRVCSLILVLARRLA